MESKNPVSQNIIHNITSSCFITVNIFHSSSDYDILGMWFDESILFYDTTTCSWQQMYLIVPMRTIHLLELNQQKGVKMSYLFNLSFSPNRKSEDDKMWNIKTLSFLHRATHFPFHFFILLLLETLKWNRNEFLSLLETTRWSFRGHVKSSTINPFKKTQNLLQCHFRVWSK